MDRNTLYVGGSGSNNYTSIQEAIDDASDGDTVYVYDDSAPYYENLIVDKSIDLIGEERNTTVIDINMSGEDGVYVSADWVNISGFHIRNAIVADAGIELHSNHSTITGNNFSLNNWTSIRTYDSNYNNISGNFFNENASCIQLWDSSNNIISGNQITCCRSGVSLVQNSRFNIISNNHIIGNGISISVGTLIYIGSDSNFNNITSNTLSDCRDGIRTYSDTSYNNFSGNIISTCVRGISLPRIRRSIVYDNQITNCDSNGLQFLSSEFNMISNNYISGNFGHGIYIKKSFIYNTISNNTINSNDGHGIFLEASSFFNTIFDNTINSNNGHGFYLKDSAHTNNIFENTISSNEGYGFYLKDFSNNNTISGNDVNSNIGHGFCLNDSSNDNTIIYNNVSINDGYGIRIENGTTPCKNNIMYYNNFVSNTFGGYDECDNIWDDGYPGGGNYWSDYIGIDDFRGPNQDMFGSDSVGGYNIRNIWWR